MKHSHRFSSLVIVHYADTKDFPHVLTRFIDRLDHNYQIIHANTSPHANSVCAFLLGMFRLIGRDVSIHYFQISSCSDSIDLFPVSFGALLHSSGSNITHRSRDLDLYRDIHT
jgi:hypothetical protein